MNRWQLHKQIQYLVRQSTWPDSPGNKIFPSASVRITNSQFPREQLSSLRYPACFVSSAGFTPHGEHPLLGTARVALTILVEHFGDAFGEAALMGANRSTTSGKSAHKGLMEVYRPVIADVARKGRETGLSIHMTGRGSDPSSVWITESRSLVAQEFSLQAQIYDDTGEYPPVSAFAGTLSGGTVSLSWTEIPVRWDNLSGATTIVRKSGSAPTSVTDGTTVSDGGVTGAATDAPGSGSWYYAALAKFNEGAGTRYSTTLRTAGPFAI